jgi:hypothetical protein
MKNHSCAPLALRSLHSALRFPITQVDAFTRRPFAGNPAAVCLLNEALDDAVMQEIAAQMNLSETAFVRREADGFRLRWFTPAVEESCCFDVAAQAGRLAPALPCVFSKNVAPLLAAVGG